MKKNLKERRTKKDKNKKHTPNKNNRKQRVRNRNI